jgi:hypothetical protein
MARNEREMGGGGGRLGAIWRKGNGREGGHSGQQCWVKDVASNGPRSSGVGGGAVARRGESGGAWATRR